MRTMKTAKPLQREMTMNNNLRDWRAAKQHDNSSLMNWIVSISFGIIFGVMCFYAIFGNYF